MAREKHIIDLTIGNFKRFHNFEVKNLGQFNLIVGDNNTGKTSFLEALLFSNNRGTFTIISHLIYSLKLRSNSNSYSSFSKKFIYDNFKLFLNNQTSESITLSIKQTDSSIYDITLRKFDQEKDINALSPLEKEKFLSSKKALNEFILSVNGYNATTLSIESNIPNYYPFIPFGEGYDNDLVDFYSKNIDINKSTRDLFIKKLRTLIPKVNDVRIGNDTINIYEEGQDTPMPLYTYGEGANKLFRILCEIAICQGKRLMIDEIDTGIHYSRFKSFWRTVLQAAKAYDVQIFATTHNIECVDYFREVLEEEEMTDYQELARVVSLKAKKDNAVKAVVYDYEAIQMAEETNFELRGGRL